MIRCMAGRWMAGWLVLAGLGMGALVQAQTGAVQGPAPLSAYVAAPEFSRVSLSANGRYLAAITPVKGRANLVVLDLQTMKPRSITALTRWDVIRYHWAGDFLLYSVGTLDTPTGAETGHGGGLFAVRVDGSDFRKLMPTVEEQWGDGTLTARFMEFLQVLPGSASEVLVSAPLRTARPDIYRVDLVSGRRTLLSSDKPGIVIEWVLDGQGVPRVAVVVDKDNAPAAEVTTTVLLRDALDQPWREIARFAFQQPGRWDPVAFAPDGRNLIVRSQRGRQTQGWHLFDVAQGKLTDTLVQHPRYDVPESGLLRQPDTAVPLGIRLHDDRVQTAYFDTGLAGLQSALEKQFPGRAVELQPSQGGPTLVRIYGDRHPSTYYLYDAQARSLKQVLRSRRDLDERHLVAMQPFLLKTRDGLEIPSYYFLPASYQPGQKLPTVVHIHGGPHVRADVWGEPVSTGVREAQLLASRGYAVVLPNFRITPGLGARIYLAGLGELGRKMSDDHEDAARWAVQQGFADPQRICISGASYGGYAALWASIRSTELFRCAVAGLVVSDLKLQLTSHRTDFSDSKSGVDFWRRLIGETKSGDWERSREVSPALHAQRSAIPLFIYAGDADRRTPLEQTEAMVDALKAAGRPAEIVMIKSEEAHGFGKTENKLDKFETMLKFLGTHIGTGPTPTP